MIYAFACQWAADRNYHVTILLLFYSMFIIFFEMGKSRDWEFKFENETQEKKKEIPDTEGFIE